MPVRKIVALVPAAWLALSCAGPRAGIEADLVLLNGTIITVDADDNVAQAVAVRNGRILAVGSDSEIRSFVGPDTRTVDLAGLTATPGLLDAHAHFSGGGGAMLYMLDLSYPTVTSMGDVIQQVVGQIERLRPGEWVRGRGWDEGKLEELRYIYASDLDSVSPDNPVWLTHTMGHYGVANSRALELAGITRSTPDPPGGTIDRGPDGTPTGVLKESAQRLVRRLIPGTTDEQTREGIAALAKEFNREGMTGLKDPGIGRSTWDAYQDVLASGELTVRVFALWRSPPTVDAARSLAQEVGSFTKPYLPTAGNHLIAGGVKLYVDGSGGARTAWMYEDWNKDSDDVDAGNRGYPAMDPDVLREQVRLYHDAGMHMSIHSIGDKGIDWVVDSYALALEANPDSGLRHGIIHANIPTDHALEVIARLQRTYDAAYPEPSATFMWWIGDTYAGNFGPERALRLNPFQTFLQAGIKWAGGSDFTVTPFPARYGIWASMARQPLLGVYGEQPYGTDETVDIRSALRSYTIWSARQMFLEDEIGSIEVGKLADIAVWDQNLYEAPVDAIKDLECQLTLFNGDIVYRNPDTPVTISGSSQEIFSP